MNTNICYHGSERKRGQGILSNQSMPVSRGSKHWLGDGIYFFTESFYSYKWIVDMFKRRYIKHEDLSYENLIKHYLILEVKINVDADRIFDFTKSEHKIIFDVTMKTVKDKLNIPTSEIPEGAVLNYMFEEMNYKDKFDYVKAVFILNQNKYKFKNRLGYMPQEQICIKNAEVVKDIRVYDFEHELESFDYQMHNMYYDNIKEHRGSYMHRHKYSIKGNSYRNTLTKEEDV